MDAIAAESNKFVKMVKQIEAFDYCELGTERNTPHEPLCIDVSQICPFSVSLSLSYILT